MGESCSRAPRTAFEFNLRVWRGLLKRTSIRFRSRCVEFSGRTGGLSTDHIARRHIGSRFEKGAHGFRDLQQASRCWEFMASREGVYDKSACAIRRAVLDSKNKGRGTFTQVPFHYNQNETTVITMRKTIALLLGALLIFSAVADAGRGTSTEEEADGSEDTVVVETDGTATVATVYVDGEALDPSSYGVHGNETSKQTITLDVALTDGQRVKVTVDGANQDPAPVIAKIE